MAFCENKMKIQSRAFQEILANESYLRDLKNRFQVNSVAWHAVWNQLDRVLARKEAYERAVAKKRMENGEAIYPL